MQPTLAVAHFQLGQVFSLLDRKEAAVRCFRRTLELAPHFIEAKLALSDVLTETYRAAEAVEMLQSIAHSGQESLKAMLHLGRAHEVLGDLAKAETTYREALRIWPNAAEPWIGLSSCKRFKAEDRADVEQLETLLRSNQFDQSTLSALHFALGKMLDDCRRYDDAFRHYQIGNDLRRELTKSEPVDFGTLTEATIAFFTPEYFASKSHVGNDTTLPIFVVGMPRSGTSLVEQIISSHPKAHGAGELYYIPQVAHGLHVLLKTNAQFPSICTQLDSENAKQIIEPYLALLRWHSPTAERVVDKMPTNFRYLGLIATLFPNARIIHCERDPMDTCLSIYFHRFARGHEYSFELQAIGHHYRNHYQRLMTHWNSALPDRIYTCNYEQLIADPETQARKLIAACGLPWDDACLAFHATKRQVRTASIAQVREGIYTRSKERWRNYEKYLGPLKEALGLNH
ncbi:MAG: sulfotransferase [Gammaproteobacteria bacterium]